MQRLGKRKRQNGVDSAGLDWARPAGKDFLLIVTRSKQLLVVLLHCAGVILLKLHIVAVSAGTESKEPALRVQGFACTLFGNSNFDPEEHLIAWSGSESTQTDRFDGRLLLESLKTGADRSVSNLPEGLQVIALGATYTFTATLVTASQVLVSLNYQCHAVPCHWLLMLGMPPRRTWMLSDMLTWIIPGKQNLLASLDGITQMLWRISQVSASNSCDGTHVNNVQGVCWLNLQ